MIKANPTLLMTPNRHCALGILRGAMSVQMTFKSIFFIVVSAIPTSIAPGANGWK